MTQEGSHITARGSTSGTGLSKLIQPRVTLQDIANAAGCSYSMVAKVSRGARRPNASIRRAVEELLGVPAWQVFDEGEA
jgi:transcriptional regulator with XRE-family HTH domain